MAIYEVGSLASFISQTSTTSKDKNEGNNSNKDLLNDLFAAASTVASTVEHVPVPSDKIIKRGKKNKRQIDQYNITNLPGGKKLKGENDEDLDDEELEKALDFENDDPYENDDDEDDPTRDAGKKLKKAELKNMKKNAQKGKTAAVDGDRVILVKNLPIKVKRRSIHHLFAKFGKIDAVWLRCAALADQAMPKKVAVIKQEFNPNRSSISAFVRFETTESALEALSLTGSEFQEQHIAVSLLSDNSKKELSKGIFVGNLPFGIEDEALWTHFGECGNIQDVRIIRDQTNGLGKGFGYVNFDSADAVELALKLNESSLCDRVIRVDRCKNKPKPKNPNQKGSAGEKGEKKSGAYRRVQEKGDKGEERKKGGGWISKMKKRQKEQNSAPGLQSFAGEAVSSDGKQLKTVRTGKAIKKTKEDIRKKSIAAKLAPKPKK